MKVRITIEVLTIKEETEFWLHLGTFVKLFSSDNSTTDIINISALK